MLSRVPGWDAREPRPEFRHETEMLSPPMLSISLQQSPLRFSILAAVLALTAAVCACNNADPAPDLDLRLLRRAPGALRLGRSAVGPLALGDPAADDDLGQYPRRVLDGPGRAGSIPGLRGGSDHLGEQTARGIPGLAPSRAV